TARVQVDSALPTFFKQPLQAAALDLTYNSAELAFKADMSQESRSLNAAGRLVLHPDHREVHVEALTLVSHSVKWSLEPGSGAIVRYGENSIDLEGVTFSSGDQRVSFTGSVALNDLSNSRLDLRLDGLNLASLADAMLLTDVNIAG